MLVAGKLQAALAYHTARDRSPSYIYIFLVATICKNSITEKLRLTQRKATVNKLFSLIVLYQALLTLNKITQTFVRKQKIHSTWMPN